MNRIKIALKAALATLVVAAALSLTPSTASAHPPYGYGSTYLNPAPTYYGRTTVRYSVPTASYYRVPVRTYYNVPARTYYRSARVVAPAYSYSFYRRPAVRYYQPAPAFQPSILTTTYYGRAVLPRRRVAVTTYYYTPSFYRY